MQFSSVKSLAFIIVSLPFYLHSEITGDLRVCALMVEFKEDNKQSTTGNGKFLNTIEGIDCESYHIDPPPHDGEYFAIRTGYYYDKTGKISNPTFGIGLRFAGYGFDFGYTYGEPGHPLTNTMRFSLNMEY